MTSFNLADLFGVVAAAVPDREVLVHGDRRLTYAQFDDRVRRLAAVLAGRGVGPGDHVGLHLHNSTEYLEGMLACYLLRAVPVNINYRYVADELRYLFDDADLVALLHEPEFVPRIAEVRADVPGLRSTLARGEPYEAALADAEPLDPASVPGRSGDDHYILYTGGTTGRPKGVVWRHEDIFFGALGGGGQPPVTTPEQLAERAERGRTRLLPACPFMHGSAHWMAFSTLFTGGSIVVDPEPGFEPGRIWQLVHDERVTFLVIVGDAFGRPLVESLAAATSGRWDLSSLTVILSGGAILSPTVKDGLLAALPGCLVVDGFGASETGGQGQMVAVPGAAGTNPRFAMDGQTTVLDDGLRPVRPGSGVVGRLARRGRVPIGYYKDPSRTAATFPVVDGVRWAVPGDLATIEEDGTVTVFGRGSVSINTGGEKVHPEEVESALKGHPSVFDAVVVGVADARWGQRVAAVVQLRPESATEPSVEDLATHARTTLAGYKVPRSVVVVDEIVRSPSGKADYRWARAVAESAVAADG
ncbi:MAG TPA: acyl-CoA synthetase [Acidimicrobiales bacterium]|nr:acyl-CoA synthetase [Acidimicrobiales bacterium]